MPGFDLPYQPIRQQLYTSTELFSGFDLNDPTSWGQTLDFTIYQHFVSEGRSVPTNPYMGMMQALHDNTITQAITTFIASRRVAAIMGDHKLARDSASYRDIATLARRLTRNDILICTGGGPGAMEASHLGALLAPANDVDLTNSLTLLRTKPVVPALANIVDRYGAVNRALVAEAHAWFKPAYEIATSTNSVGRSLAIPTWHYGHEPSTPFATNIAKYFQNSIREDGLLALANQGIIYSEGKAGTIQEIFQDSTQNYYRTFGQFSPMVLFGVDYWTTTYPIIMVLQKLFTADDFARYVLITDDVNEAAKFIENFVP